MSESSGHDHETTSSPGESAPAEPGPAGASHVTLTHVPTQQDILQQLEQQGIHDLGDLAKEVVDKAREARESDDEVVVDFVSTPSGYVIHVHTTSGEVLHW